jgi:hypothetical protein
MKVIKNDYLELPVYSSLSVFKLFKEKYGKSIEQYFGDANADNMDAFGFLVYQWHLAACKLTGTTPQVASVDEVLEKLTMEDLPKITEILGGKADSEQKKMT